MLSFLVHKTAPRRQREIGEWGELRLSSETWAASKKADPDGPLPWLRIAQGLGTEIVIIGHTLDACSVCVEAWHAGFRPVLVIIEDQISNGQDGKKVHAMMEALNQATDDSGFFRHGPGVISSHSSKCIINLDDDGQITETLVRINVAGGLNTRSECWQLFKGPGIVVDLYPMVGLPAEAVRASQRLTMAPNRAKAVETGGHNIYDLSQFPTKQVKSMEHAVDDADAYGEDFPNCAEKVKSFISRAVRERHLVTTAQFWEERYLADCFPFTTPSYSSVLPPVLVAMAGIFTYVYQYKFLESEDFTANRLVYKAIPEMICFTSLCNMYSMALGITMPNYRPCVVTLLGGIVGTLSSIISCFGPFGESSPPTGYDRSPWAPTDFATATVGVCFMLTYTFGFAVFKTRGKLKKYNIMWFCATVCSTFGYWLLMILVIASYLLLQGVSPSIAALFLTGAFSATECVTVEVMLALYIKLVYKPRLNARPNACLGEQKTLLAFCILSTHAFTESGRLVALICGAAGASTRDYLGSVLLSFVSGLVLNVLNRTLWMLCIGAKIVGPKYSWLCCPTFITAFHMDCKYAMGWPRFFVISGIILSRGFMWNDWSLDWFMEGEADLKRWCWNGLVLITIFLVFIAEILEDWCVFTVNQKMPAPVWQCFSEDMTDQFLSPGMTDLYHTSHFLVPTDAMNYFVEAKDHQGPEDKAKASTMLKKQGTMAGKRLSASVMVGSQVSDLAPHLMASPNFKHSLEFSRFNMLGVCFACNAVIAIGLSSGLGLEGVTGYCRPHNIKDDSVYRILVGLFIGDTTKGYCNDGWTTSTTTT